MYTGSNIGETREGMTSGAERWGGGVLLCLGPLLILRGDLILSTHCGAAGGRLLLRQSTRGTAVSPRASFIRLVSMFLYLYIKERRARKKKKSGSRGGGEALHQRSIDHRPFHPEPAIPITMPALLYTCRCPRTVYMHVVLACVFQLHLMAG